MAENFFWTFLILVVVSSILWSESKSEYKKNNLLEQRKCVLGVYAIISNFSFYGCLASSIWWIWS